uniref:Uncharacterized protein n=1 Tax=Hyaloperonospora arabidopsidis (strain Emoy2) TaxID=559515 RepID=M4B5H2_HYAAE
MLTFLDATVARRRTCWKTCGYQGASTKTTSGDRLSYHLSMFLVNEVVGRTDSWACDT